MYEFADYLAKSWKVFRTN